MADSSTTIGTDTEVDLRQSVVRQVLPPLNARQAVHVFVVAAVYFLAARLGLTLAFAYKNISPVWPPSGVALAALILYGRHLWPGIALGAFLANYSTGIPIFYSAIIAIGNTLESLAGMWIVQRAGNFHTSLTRLHDILRILLASTASPAIAATIGAASVAFSHKIPWSEYFAGWLTWWLGDGMGILVLTPALLVWLGYPISKRHDIATDRLRLYGEAACLGLAIIVTLYYVMFDHGQNYRYAVFPLLIWAAMRFGMRGSTLVVLVLTGVGIAATLKGFGPFVVGAPAHSLIYLQTFIAVAALTSQMLAASVSEKIIASRNQLNLLAQLRDKGRQLDQIVTTVPAVVWEAYGQPDEASQRIDFVSSYVEQMLGYSVEEWLSTPNFWLTIVHPDDKDGAVRVANEAYESGGSHTNRFRWIARDGRVLWVESHSVTIQDSSGQPIGMRGITMDITERKLAHDALQASRDKERQFGQLLTELHEVSNRLSMSATFDDLCRDAVQLGRARLGIDRVGIWFISDDPSVIQGSFGTAEDGELRDERESRIRVSSDSLMGRALSGGERVVCDEGAAIHDHCGERVGAGWHALAAMSDGEKVIGVVSADNYLRHEPLTEQLKEILSLYAVTIGHLASRKRAEEALERNQAHIAELNRHLQNAMTETHHRVKNNLQTIAAMIEMRIQGEAETALSEDLKRLGSCVLTLAAVHELLTREARQDAQADNVSGKELLGRLVPLLAHTADNHEIRHEAEDVRISARQGTAVALIVNELVSNAIKHGAGPIEIKLSRDDDHAKLEVLDRGPGFPDEFKPGDGTTIGVELVQRLGRWDMQGHTSFENRPDGGASVTVVFPIA